MHKYIFLIILLLFASTLFGQDVESLLKRDSTKGFFAGFKDAKPFDITGSLTLNLRAYQAAGTTQRQSPFTWFTGAQANISIYKINIPISTMVSAQSQTFSHPFHNDVLKGRFARFGASPYYKWIKVHGGHRNMNFSPLTVANHTYFGGGVELTPGNFRFATFYGKMAKTEPRDLSLRAPNQEIFQRKGYGMKVGYGTEQAFIDLIAFKAKDDPASLAFFNADTATIFQNENLVIGLNGQATLFEKLTLNVEIASSAFTKNLADPLEGANEFPHPSFLLESHQSTVFRKAIDAGLKYQLGVMSLGIGYKRVDPEYRSLGAYFFNNDLEDVTLNFGLGLFNNTLNISGRGGIQKNNILSQKATQFTRTIASLNINYSLKALSLGLNYSNYSSDIQYVLNPDLDSLNAIVVTQQAGITASYALKDGRGNRHTITSAFSVQAVADDLQNLERSAESKMLTGNLIYVFTPTGTGWKLRGRVNYNKNELSNILINRYGAGLGAQKELVKEKLSLSLNTNYYLSKGDMIDNQTLNLRLSLPFSPSEKHQFDLGILYLNRLKSTSTTGNFSETTGILNYTFSF